MATRSGYVPFIPKNLAQPCRLWYTVTGDLHLGRPLITISGGPGVSHDYLSSLRDLCSPNRPVVFWDQLGTGRSTHLPSKLHDSAFWTEELFLSQVHALLSHLSLTDDFDLLGHSWGGMLGAAFAATQPCGLRRLILSNVPFSSALWLDAYRSYRDRMPPAHREVLMRQRTGIEATREPRYVNALGSFLSRHFCTLDPLPDDSKRSQESVEADPTVWLSMLGPDEFVWTGTLKDWTMEGRAHLVEVPTLLLSGTDEGACDVSQRRFLDAIPGARCVRFTESTHMPHLEERGKYMDTLAGFLGEDLQE